MNRTRVPGEVDAFATNFQGRADGEAPGVDELRAVVTRIGYNRIARAAATGEGFANEAEADLLMVLALEGLDVRARDERARKTFAGADRYPDD